MPNMTSYTKNIIFYAMHVKVSRDTRRSRTLAMNVAIKSAHCGCERNSCKDWAWWKMCGKHGRIWSKAEHCIKVWYSDSRTCLGKSVHSRPLSSLVPQRPVSHRNACELSHMEAMVRMVDNGMGSNMYRCVQFPRSAKNMDLYLYASFGSFCLLPMQF